MSFIILDRDGVINFDSNEYIKSADEWKAIPGSLEAIAQLNRAGFRVLVATNQSGIARGLFNLDDLHQMHEKLFRELATVGGHIEEIFFCPHHPADNCGCRKPKPGLFHQIYNKYQVTFAETFYIGDSITDAQVAKVVGCKPLFVKTGRGQEMLNRYQELSLIPHFFNLSDAVNYVLKNG